MSTSFWAAVAVLWMTIAAVAAAATTTNAPNALSFPKGQVVGFWWMRKSVLNEAAGGGVASASLSTPTQLASQIRSKMLAVKSQSITAEGKVDYTGIKDSDAFRSYLSLTQQLRTVDLGALSAAGKKSCLLNLYNCLLIHAVINGLLDVKGGTLARVKLYASAAYSIGGTAFSLNDIENGLLRGNRKSAVPLTGLPFPDESDPRRRLQLECDPRIHFALNCGAVSCPPIGVYTEEDVDAELSLATEGFLDQSVETDPTTKTLTLSMLFSWYRQDFGATDAEVFSWIKRHASPELKARLDSFQASLGPAGLEGLKIAYAPYDWRLND